MQQDNVIGGALLVLLLLAVAYFATRPKPTLAIDAGNTGTAAPPIASNASVLAAGCYACNASCKVGACTYGCPAGITALGSTTPVIISDYRTPGDPDAPSWTIDGTKYWFRQPYAGAACIGL